MINTIPNVPGVHTTRTASARRVLMGDAPPRYLPGGKIIDGSKSRDPLNTGDLDVLRAGLLMGKITSGGKYAPSILGVTTVAFDTDASDPTSITVSAATATELVRRIGSSGTFKLTGPPAAAGTVATQTVTFSAVNTTTGVITVTDPGADAIAGSFVQPTDGSETILTFVNAEFGIKVTDQDASNVDVPFAQIPVEGIIDFSQLINAPSDTSLIAYVKAALRAVGLGYSFDDDF